MLRNAIVIASVLGLVPLLVVVSSEPEPSDKTTSRRSETTNELGKDNFAAIPSALGGKLGEREKENGSHFSPDLSEEAAAISFLRSEVDPESRETSDEFQAILSDLIQNHPVEFPPTLENENIIDQGMVQDIELVNHLRLTSKLLDRKADQLEETQKYQQADKLRRLSKKMRKSARDWDRPTTAMHAPLSPSENLP